MALVSEAALLTGSHPGLMPAWPYFQQFSTGDQASREPAKKSPTPLTEKDVKVMKRKHANRESARRSKLRKKQEAEELQQKIDVLGEEHAALEAQVDMLHMRLESLRKANQALKLEVVELGGNPDDYPEIAYESDKDDGGSEQGEESCQSSSSQG